MKKWKKSSQGGVWSCDERSFWMLCNEIWEGAGSGEVIVLSFGGRRGGFFVGIGLVIAARQTVADRKSVV